MIRVAHTMIRITTHVIDTSYFPQNWFVETKQYLSGQQNYTFHERVPCVLRVHGLVM